MKILTASQIKEADRYTIEHEPISSIDLMERASNRIAQWIINNIDKKKPLLFLIGKGNNGGDGLAVSRILHHAGYNCSIYLVFKEEELSEECKFNNKRLPVGIKKINFLEDITYDHIIIDALLGTGIKRELKEPSFSLIRKINLLPNKVISIDLPSGMMTEFGNVNQPIVKADVTLTLQFPKLAMLLPEAGEYCGEVNILPIGLSEDFIQNANTPYYYTTKTTPLSRNKFAHKGTYGHALLICGSRNMAGAGILATGGALRSGCGLVTIHIPAEERLAIYTNFPSAILSPEEKPCFSTLPEGIEKYTSIGIGCGLGQARPTIDAFTELLKETSAPMVIDADALNILANHPTLRQYIPEGSILTPHPKELRRLVGDWDSEEQKIGLVRQLANSLKSVIIVKGAHTMVCSPNGDCYFNSTGNSGMAKGGSGDVLTGYLAGLLARGYSSLHAAIYGVYMHGLAGDKAAKKLGMEAMNSKDLIDHLSI